MGSFQLLVNMPLCIWGILIYGESLCRQKNTYQSVLTALHYSSVCSPDSFTGLFLYRLQFWNDAFTCMTCWTVPQNLTWSYPRTRVVDKLHYSCIFGCLLLSCFLSVLTQLLGFIFCIWTYSLILSPMEQEQHLLCVYMSEIESGLTMWSCSHHYILDIL